MQLFTNTDSVSYLVLKVLDPNLKTHIVSRHVHCNHAENKCLIVSGQ